MNQRHCTGCGFSIQGDAEFCDQCGTHVPVVQAPPQAQDPFGTPTPAQPFGTEGQQPFGTPIAPFGVGMATPPPQPGVIARTTRVHMMQAIVGWVLLPVSLAFTLFFALYMLRFNIWDNIGVGVFIAIFVILDAYAIAWAIYHTVMLARFPKDRIIWDGNQLILWLNRKQSVQVRPMEIASVTHRRLNVFITGWWFIGDGAVIIYTQDQTYTVGHCSRCAAIALQIEGMRGIMQ